MTKIYSTKNLNAFFQDVEGGLLEDHKKYGALSIFKFMVLKEEIIFWDHSQNYVYEHKQGLKKYREQQGIESFDQFGGGEVFLSTKNDKHTLTFKGGSISLGIPKEYPFKKLFNDHKNEFLEKGIDVDYPAGYESSWKRAEEKRLMEEKNVRQSKRFWLIVGLIATASALIYFLY